MARCQNWVYKKPRSQSGKLARDRSQNPSGPWAGGRRPPAQAAQGGGLRPPAEGPQGALGPLGVRALPAGDSLLDGLFLALQLQKLCSQFPSWNLYFPLVWLQCKLELQMSHRRKKFKTYSSFCSFMINRLLAVCTLDAAGVTSGTSQSGPSGSFSV